MTFQAEFEQPIYFNTLAGDPETITTRMYISATGDIIVPWVGNPSHAAVSLTGQGLCYGQAANLTGGADSANAVELKKTINYIEPALAANQTYFKLLAVPGRAGLRLEIYNSSSGANARTITIGTPTDYFFGMDPVTSVTSMDCPAGYTMICTFTSLTTKRWAVQFVKHTAP